MPLSDLLAGSHLADFLTRTWARVIRRLEGARRRLTASGGTPPWKAGGTVLLWAVFTHALSIGILGKKVGPMGMVLQVILLAIGALGLTCPADWDAIRSGSWLLRRLSR